MPHQNKYRYKKNKYFITMRASYYYYKQP